MPRWDDAPMVGRASELAHLLACLDRAASGRTSSVLLSGDAGVGKTRLLDELTASAAGRGVRVLVGHCVDLGDVGLPYLPFVDLLRPVAADPGLAPTAASNPVLAALLAGRPVSSPPVQPVAEGRDLGQPLPHRAAPRPVDDGRLQLFESVAGLICELASDTPLLMVLEDVHWADRSSRDLLRYLLARLVDVPVSVVASYRADDLHRRHPLRPLLAELVRLPGVERLELAPLPDAEVGTLVRRLAAAGSLPESAVEDVVARAEGNAFYAEELLAAGLHGEALPLGLTDVLLARVEQRSPAAQQVLRIAAVAGRRVRHELVAAVGELAGGELEEALSEAVHHHLLVVSDDGRYRFRHALLREAVLADLLPGSGCACTPPSRATWRASLARARPPNAPITRGRATTWPVRSAPLWRRRPPPAASAPRPSSCSTWNRPWPCGRRCPTPAASRAVTRPPCCWRRRGRHGPWGRCTVPSRCCVRRSRSSARTPTRERGHGSTTRWPRPWCGSRTSQVPTARALPRWRWCPRSHRRRCARGRRRRTPG
ncbi:ATP-binding protein [Blastococcus brunescens]|uniref:AAA family ATPase n=1 Tax=Blastococcus brunescens TaxID=1564165 RepID=A0ABZ1B1A6_9ACTN|nr:AAA family ATPase [Blastococcus sp. BMG 8361]WRL64597.1 AAA family ATPase [Blastococcus sp. BMG 8361]